MSAHRVYQINRMNPIVALLGLAMIIVVLFWIAKGVLRLLSLAAPLLFIATLIINYRVVLGYGKWLLDLLKRNVLFGLLAVVFSVIGFPLVTLFLFVRALSSKDKSDRLDLKKGEYIRYEEVNEDFLDISELQERNKKIDNDYNDILK